MFPSDYPEEYIRGSVRFFGRDFRVNPNVLIPRLETESLIRRVFPLLRELPEWEKSVVVDIGSGSGIIGTSLAPYTDEVFFLDISRDTLQVAKTNFLAHFPHKRAHFLESDLLINLPKNLLTDHVFLVTNLPYIRDADWENMSEDTKYEPSIALFWGGKTGFELYEKLFAEIREISWNAQTLTLAIEFGYDQRTVADEVLSQCKNWQYEFFADHAGIERFALIDITT